MGIGRQDIELLIRLRQQEHIPLKGRVIELGAQQLSHNLLSAPHLIRELGRKFQAEGEPPLPIPKDLPESDGIEERLDPNAPRARDLWCWLGFEYAAIDIDGGPNNICLDLNFDDVPTTEKNKYHVVTNYGTTEHVSNQLNAFKVCHELTAVEGIMIHHVPSQGNFSHGMFNYTPKFFWMLARSNEYKWMYLDYSCSNIYYALPNNLIEGISQFEPDIGERITNYRTSNTAIIVALQKSFDTPYVPALDIPNGSRTDDEVLLSRYPTVLKPRSGARSMLQRAAEAGNARAAFALASTYDPIALRRFGIQSLTSDVAKARFWYKKASELGSSEAPHRLDSISSRTH
jgi:hypothetical protein